MGWWWFWLACVTTHERSERPEPEPEPTSTPTSTPSPTTPSDTTPPTTTPTVPASGVPTCAEDPLGFFTPAALDPPTSGSGEYAPPAADALTALRDAMTAFHDGRPEDAVVAAVLADYEVCTWPELDPVFVAWRPLDGHSGHARVLVSLDPAALPLIVEAPHSFYDWTTDQQAVLVFERVGARAVIVSGTHRCATEAPAGCDGYTDACGGYRPYPVSDMAHAVDSAFQVAHEVLTEVFPTDVALSLHGFPEPGASVSNGTVEPTTETSAPARIATELMAAFPDEPITTCNDFPGGVFVDRWCSTTNTQGRHLNGSATPCTEPAVAPSDRFVHLEQSAELRGQPELVADALAAALAP